MRILARGALALVTVVVALGVGHPASAETGVPASEKCEITSDQQRINIVMLLDASRSLNRTDPTNSRRGGLEAAISNLASLARNNPQVSISMAVDTFATVYFRWHGWADAGTSELELYDRYDAITAINPANTGSSTDYRAALGGVADRLRVAPAARCNVLLWFTDGEHATDGTSADISASEWEQLRRLCASDDMAFLSDSNLYTIGVLLSRAESPTNPAPLRYVFGEGDRHCQYPLDGDLRDDVDTGDLREALDELINEVVYELEVEADSDHDLPGEPNELPEDEAYEVCSGGEGTSQDPCEYSFRLDSGVESFRVFLDLTYLERGITNPDQIEIALRSPRGVRSSAIETQRVDADEMPQYQPVHPFWFLARRPYDSRWEIIGHQAAEQIAQQGDWEWQGDWTLLLWGETPQGAEEAAKVAGYFREIKISTPNASMSVNEQGKLIGFVQDFPADYESADLRMKLTDSSGQLVYPTRPHLKCRVAQCDPLSVSELERRFEVPSILEEVVWWNSEPAGGDGSTLQKILPERGPMRTVAELDQVFLYGGVNGWGEGGTSGQSLVWARDIGNLELIGIGDLLAGLDAWESLAEWVDSGVPQALPSGLRLEPPPYGIDGDSVTFRVVVAPGILPGEVSLTGVEVNSDAVSSPRYDRSWTCSVPGGESSPSGEFQGCRPIRIDLGFSEDDTAAVRMDFRIASADGLEQVVRSGGLSVPSEQEWTEVWAEIQSATAPRQQTLNSERFDIDVLTPADRLSKFVPILVGLVLLALILRYGMARRLRPWSALESPEYVSMSLSESSDASIVEARSACMDLSGERTSGDLASVTLVSALTPLLFGRPPTVEARSSAGDCLGRDGSRESRKGNRIGIIGNDLRQGWVVESVGGQHRLYVWDLPNEELEARYRVREAREEAESRLGESAAPTDREARAAAAPEPSSERPGSAPPPDPFSTSRDPFDFGD